MKVLALRTAILVPIALRGINQFGLGGQRKLFVTHFLAGLTWPSALGDVDRRSSLGRGPNPLLR